jgi:glycosyltransferase involved in cell wall biosynthesis
LDSKDKSDKKTNPVTSTDKNKNKSQSSYQNKKSGGRSYYNRGRRSYKKNWRRSDTPQFRTSFKKISIIVPLFNEEESIHPLVNEIKKVLNPLGIQYEVIMVDDGSTDLSLRRIKEVAGNDRRYKYISFRKNYGKSAALDEGYDLCSGWKKNRQDPFIKKHSSVFFNFATRLMSGIKIHDFNCGLKAYRKEVVQNLKVYGELHRYVPVLAKWQGFTITEIPVQHQRRRYGKTKYGISRFFKGFVDLITVIFSTRYIKRPLHFFGFFGALSFLAGLGILGYLSALWIQGQPLSNRPMLFLGMLMIIVGVQFFAVGLLGEMLVHSSMDEKEYIIKDKN